MRDVRQAKDGNNITAGIHAGEKYREDRIWQRKKDSSAAW